MDNSPKQNPKILMYLNYIFLSKSLPKQAVSVHLPKKDIKKVDYQLKLYIWDIFMLDSMSWRDCITKESRFVLCFWCFSGILVDWVTHYSLSQKSNIPTF